MRNKIRFIPIILILSSTLFFTACRADEDNLSLFPIEHYSQNINDWIKPTDENYDKPVISSEMQQQRLKAFYDRLYGIHSPWNVQHVNQIIAAKKPDDLKSVELSVIDLFSNHDKPLAAIGYGENFRPHTQEWLNEIVKNIPLTQLRSLEYNSNNRAIAIDNLHARALPTEDVHFYSYKIAGQGYPFDNLQISALWVGTPVYILAQTNDHAWSMVLTPDYIAWVKSTGIARVNSTFVEKWQAAAKKQLIAITHTSTSILDSNHQFRFVSYVGAVFPGRTSDQGYRIMIPIADAKQKAVIRYAIVAKQHAATIPITATPHHFTNIMSSLLGRPYGWGNAYFYNDCSSELKSLFTPFGIWLPRHSSDQLEVGKMVDMSSSSPKQRLDYLMENGRRFMTLIYVGGHVVLFIGNYPNPQDKNHALMAMTYQNFWGLSPKPSTRRAVIGQSALFPWLLKYPEDSDLVSQVGKKYFQVSYLDVMPAYLLKLQAIDLRMLMLP